MKKVIMSCLVTAILLSVLSVVAFALYGDLNSDRLVDGRDAVKLAQYLAKWDIDFTAEDEKNADVFYDGKINATDAVKVAQYLAGWNVKLGPKGEDVEVDADDILGDGTDTSGDTETTAPVDTEQSPEQFEPEEYLEFEDGRYRLTFFDGFDGTKLDTTKWERCPEWDRHDLGGKWDDDRAYLDGNGNLVLEAKRDANGNLTSGAIRTQNKRYTKIMFEQARGYFECSARLQSEPGFWSAFWLMCSGEEKVGNGAVDGAEIDIMESYSVEKEGINHAIHWDGYGADHKSTGKGVEGLNVYDGEYHTFGLLWTETAYVFYIDGVETYRVSEGMSNWPGSCQAACYLKLTIEFGSWADAMDGRAFTDSVLFDYVRVYQKES